MLHIPFVKIKINKIVIKNLEKYFNKYKLFDKIRIFILLTI
jgi:hypothetical protein